MNAQLRQVVIALLDVLSELDGGVISEPQLHGAVALRVLCTLGDFEEALHHCDAQKWASGLTGKLHQRKWALTDAGELARRELHRG